MTTATETKPDLLASITGFRAHRFTSPKYVRCPNNCAADIGCANCQFWGTVERSSPDAVCAHRYLHVGTIGECLNTYACADCGAIKTVDSSG